MLITHVLPLIISLLYGMVGRSRNDNARKNLNMRILVIDETEASYGN